MAEAIATKVSAEVNGAAVYDFTPPIEVGGEAHIRGIVARAFGETHVFPTSGPVRVIGKAPTEHLRTALGSFGYKVA